MTTIAYRDGILAVDRMATFGDIKESTDHKLEVFRRPYSAVAIAGTLALGIAFFDWCREGRQGKFELDPWTNPDKEYVTALIVTRINASNCKVEYHTGNQSIEWPSDRYRAIGNGAEFAMGAMHHGATAVEAVQAAIEHSVYSGYGVVWVDITKTELEKVTI